MRYVLAGEYWNVAICSVHVFLYMTDPIEWGNVSPAISKT